MPADVLGNYQFRCIKKWKYLFYFWPSVHKCYFWGFERNM